MTTVPASGAAGDAPRSPGSTRAPVADERTVRGLLRAELPELADRPLVPGPAGWDNAHWLVGGTELAVRLPRRELAVGLVANEVRALRTLGPTLPLATPVPTHVGRPGPDWPWPWTVVPWLAGERADLAYPPASPEEHAAALGGFLAAVHVAAPVDVPVNPFRGVPLAGRQQHTERALAALDRAGAVPGHVRAVLRRRWEEGLAAAVHEGPTSWIHGDLHPGNQLVGDGRLVAVVDWGDASTGDPASDLATAWWTLPTAVHGDLRAAYGGMDEDTWARAAAWAAAIAAYILEQGPRTGDTALLAVAQRTVQRLGEA